MDEEQVQSSEVIVTENMINSLRCTRPWTKFLSIMAFIGLGCMVIAGLIMLVAGKYLPGQSGSGLSALVGVVYLVAAALYLFPALYVFKYSSAVGRFLVSKKAIDMESALANQKSFWKFIGILCLVISVIAVVGILAAIILAAFAGSRL